MKNQFLLKGYYLKFFFLSQSFFDRIFLFFRSKFFFESKNFFNQKIKINPISIKKIFHTKKENLGAKKYLGSK